MKAEERTFGIEDFWKNGFAGPFASNVSAQSIDDSVDFVSNMVQAKSKHPLYDRYSVRDWHLLKLGILELFQDENLIASMQQLLGEDLILWRTKIFSKEPYEGEIGWHQEWGAFNGEEIGNDVPALQYPGTEDFWDLTVWIALCDMSLDMSPIRFARGTHEKRFPIEMAPLHQSEFFTNPFGDIQTKKELLQRAQSNSLILDIDTSTAFCDKDLQDPNLTLVDAQQRVMQHIKNARGAVTLGFDPDEHEIVSLDIKKGDYWIFTERVMHGSGINTTDRNRLAINGRITRSNTLVYPGRLRNEWMDGSNINISKHQCILLSGQNLEPRNNVNQDIGKVNQGRPTPLLEPVL